MIGGAAGCFPVLVGWAAVTGTRRRWPAVVLFAVIFFWTPPHFWALAMKFRDDYAAASVPMLPVVAAPRGGGQQDRVLFLRDGRGHAGAGAVRGLDLRGCAAGLGAWFLVEAHRLRWRVAHGDAAGPDAAVPLSRSRT